MRGMLTRLFRDTEWESVGGVAAVLMHRGFWRFAESVYHHQQWGRRLRFENPDLQPLPLITARPPVKTEESAPQIRFGPKDWSVQEHRHANGGVGSARHLISRIEEIGTTTSPARISAITATKSDGLHVKASFVHAVSSIDLFSATDRPRLAETSISILVSGSYGSSVVSRKGGKSSVFSLFNLKQKSKFWSESVIHEDFDDLESSVSSNSGKMGVLNYTMAGNIASYLRLSEVDSIYLPVPVNFIFIGFEGKGNQGGAYLNLRYSFLRRNFKEHIIEKYFEINDTLLLIPQTACYTSCGSSFYVLFKIALTKDIVKGKRPLHSKHPMTKFAWTMAEDIDTVEWSNMCLNALSVVEQLYHGNDTAEIISSKAKQILHGGNEDMKLLLKKELKTGKLAGLHAECLTDTWIGRDRWAFIDLTAGPFSWGPAVGGEGVRTDLSLPNVGKTIGAVSEMTEEEAEDRLQQAIQERFSVFGDQEHHAIDVLLAEVDIYEAFAFKHCKGRKVRLALCEELDARMGDLKNELQSFNSGESDNTHKAKALDTLRRMEKWNLFSDVNERVKKAEHLPVELKALMDGLTSLLVPSQKSNHKGCLGALNHVTIFRIGLTLSDDPALAMAFSVSRRAAAVPLLLINGTYRSTVHTYLDSSILQHQLQRLSDHGSLKGAHSHSRSTLEVPIFWFIHGDPLFVDKHYQAKALSDMLILNEKEWLLKPANFHRRPIKAAVAATAEHLAGVLPLHLVYSQAHETAVEDMTVSETTSINRLDGSVITSQLSHYPSRRTFKLFKSKEQDLVNRYTSVVSMWRRSPFSIW
ncbi:hypothetical protein ACLOJK_030906 [Asimina triloba]